MAYSRGQALLNLDMYREREDERKLFEQAQNEMQKRGKWASLWSGLAGLGTAFGMVNPLAGIALAALGRMAPRAFSGRGLKMRNLEDWYGPSQDLKKKIKGGRFFSDDTAASLDRLEGAESWFADAVATLGDIGTGVTQAGGIGALKDSPVGALKEMTTFGKSWEGGKPGMFGKGYVPTAQTYDPISGSTLGPVGTGQSTVPGYTGFATGAVPTADQYQKMSAQQMWKQGMFNLQDVTDPNIPGSVIGQQVVPPTAADPGQYTRGTTLGRPKAWKTTGKYKFGQPLKNLQQAKLFRPSTWTRPFGLDIMTGGPGFDRFDYMTDIGDQYLTQQLAAPGTQQWLNNLYNQ